MRKTRSFVLITILAIAFSASLGSSFARADSDSDDKGSVLDSPGYDPDYHLYQLAPSRWAMGLRAAMSGFPINSAVGNSYQIYGEWVLPFQKSGLFSLGGHYGAFPINSSAVNAAGNTIPYPNYLSQMGGLQFRYQFRYSLNQFIVPTIALEADYYNVAIGTAVEDRVSGILFGGSAGLMINLGWIDRDTARDAYQTLSLTRTYLTLEIHPIDFSGPSITFSGNFLYMGLRLEFE